MGGLRLGLLSGFAASFLVVLAGCGGRTSTLDPDMVSVDPNLPSDGSKGGASNGGPKPTTGTGAVPGTAGSKGGLPSGTAGSTGAGAASSTGGSSPGGSTGVGTAGSSAGPLPTGGASSTGGAVGVGGIDGWAFNNCLNYCSISSPPQPCTSGLSSAECSSSCTTELGRLDSTCQKVAGNLLECLTTVYKNSSNCGEVQLLSSSKCSNLFASYERCADQAPTPPPTPTPTPTSCMGSGSAGAGKCSLEMKCANGVRYFAYCSQIGDSESSCSCAAISPDGSSSGTNFSLSENAYDACEDSLALCGYPHAGLK